MRLRQLAVAVLLFPAAAAVAQRAVIGGVACGITDDGKHSSHLLIDCSSDSDCREKFAEHLRRVHNRSGDESSRPAVVQPGKTLIYLPVAGAISGWILGDSRTDENGDALPSLAGPGAMAGGGGGLLIASVLNAPRVSPALTILTSTLGGALLGAGVGGIEKDKTGVDETAKMTGIGAGGGAAIGVLFGAAFGAARGGSSKLRRLGGSPIRPMLVSGRVLGVSLDW